MYTVEQKRELVKKAAIGSISAVLPGFGAIDSVGNVADILMRNKGRLWDKGLGKGLKNLNHTYQYQLGRQLGRDLLKQLDNMKNTAI